MSWSQRVGFRTRVAMVAAAAVGIAVALASAASYLAVRHQLVNQVDVQLHRQATVVHQHRAQQAVPTLQAVLNTLGRSGLSSLGGVQIIRSNGRVLASEPPRELPVSSADKAVAAGHLTASIRTIGRPGNGDHARVLTVPMGTGYALQLSRPLYDIDHTLGKLALILLLVAASGIVLALILGYLVARASLRPVERLTEAVERVATTRQLDQTIEVAGDDELSRLAVSFNNMLATLDGSRRQQAQLVADAGHELRTPLTSLRTNIEVLIKIGDLPNPDREALLADVIAQLEELTTLVGDLVELAREDEREREPGQVRLDLVVDKAVERARRRAGSVDFDVSLDRSLVRAQPGLLERAILNVLDNAAKWAPSGSTVVVTLKKVGGSWQLDTRDYGPGISDEDLPHVFDRFYRSASARSLPGSGLGLAIVRRVVESSGGKVEAIAPPDGGTLLRLALPAVDESLDESPVEPTPRTLAPSRSPV